MSTRGRKLGEGRHAAKTAASPPFRNAPTHLYAGWLTHIFGEVDGPPREQLDFDFDSFPASPDEMSGLFILTMQRAGEDLSWASDEQIYAGLSALLNPCWSDICHTIRTTGIREQREAAVRSIEHLYHGLFSRRCKPVLGHLSERGTAINDICYMLWDVTLFGYDEDSDGRAEQEWAVAVMRAALGIDHDACQESALHGLGHLEHYRPDLVRPIIEDFLQCSENLRPELVAYACQAACGRVQ